MWSRSLGASGLQRARNPPTLNPEPCPEAVQPRRFTRSASTFFLLLRCQNTKPQTCYSQSFFQQFRWLSRQSGRLWLEPGIQGCRAPCSSGEVQIGAAYPAICCEPFSFFCSELCQARRSCDSREGERGLCTGRALGSCCLSKA